MANICKHLKGRRVLQFCLLATGLVIFAVLYNKTRLSLPEDDPDIGSDYFDTRGYAKADQLIYFNKEVSSDKNVNKLKEALGSHRIVHLDLKGAVPKVSYFAQLLPFIKKLGATGILLEYEDTFPYMYADIAGSHGYSKSDIEEILRYANKSQLTVIPLIQTFGHLEFALKLERYKQLRESIKYPQAICPSKNESLKFLYNMIDEVIEMHEGLEYMHIGCDEVYQLGICQDCRTKLLAESWSPQELFLDHVSRIARYVKQKHPSVNILIWDDELRNIPLEVLTTWKLGQLVEPVVWKYTGDVEADLHDGIWKKYTKLFPHIWFATAFKGAKSPDAITNSISLYLDNHRSWVKLIKKYSQSVKFRGGILTGWQRYDHFSVLCELLPISIPSLAVNLIYLGSESKTDLVELTSVAQTMCQCDSNPVLTLSNYLVHCVFPGSHVFHAISRLSQIFDQIDILKESSPYKGWLTLYNRNHSYSAPSHVEEASNELVNLYSDVVSLEREIEEAMEPVYKPDTFIEWSSTYILPVKNELKSIVQARDKLLAVDSWPKRPLV